jgi:hypothetical protein
VQAESYNGGRKECQSALIPTRLGGQLRYLTNQRTHGEDCSLFVNDSHDRYHLLIGGAKVEGRSERAREDVCRELSHPLQ